MIPFFSHCLWSYYVRPFVYAALSFPLFVDFMLLSFTTGWQISCVITLPCLRTIWLLDPSLICDDLRHEWRNFAARSLSSHSVWQLNEKMYIIALFLASPKGGFSSPGDARSRIFGRSAIAYFAVQPNVKTWKGVWKCLVYQCIDLW